MKISFSLLLLLLAVTGCRVHTKPTQEFPAHISHAAPSHQYNVRDAGAIGDGKALDTPAINKTIESAGAAGGGTVYFPPGTYLCYSIHLNSNVALYLDAGATILAAENPLKDE